MVSKDTQIVLLFVVLGTALWFISGEFIHNEWIRWAILLDVGVVIPTILTERRNSHLSITHRMDVVPVIPV